MKNSLEYGGGESIRLPWQKVWKQKFMGLVDRVYWLFNRPIPLSIVVLGPESSGKTSVIRRFAGDAFYEEKFEPLSCTFKTVCVLKVHNKLRRFKVKIAELPRKKMSSRDYHEKVSDSSGVVFVYSTDEPTQYNELNNIIDKLYSTGKTNKQKKPSVLVLGNKTEICTNLEQVYQNTEIKDLVQSAGINYFSVSAKSNWGIYDAFDELFLQCALDRVGKSKKRRSRGRSSPRKSILLDAEEDFSFSEI